MWTEFFLTLKPHYCFHSAISQEDVNKAYLRNISIFFSLSLSWKKEQETNSLTPLELSELCTLLSKFREGSLLIYYKSVTFELIFESVS